VAAPPTLQQKDQPHDQELAAWHARDAANRAAADRMDRLDRMRRWVAWRLAPAGAVLPVTVAAIAYGWGPLDLVSVVPSLPSLPAVSVWAMLGTVATVGVCAFMASRAERVPRAWGWAAGAVMAGVLLLVAARSLPLHIFKIGVVTSAGRSYPGVVVRLHFNGTLANLEVLRGAGTIRRGQMLNWDVDPTTFFGGR
jgi:hypothetical protein